MNRLVTLVCCRFHVGYLYIIDENDTIIKIVRYPPSRKVDAVLRLGFQIGCEYEYEEVSNIQTLLLTLTWA